MARRQFHTKAKPKQFYDMAIKKWGEGGSSRYLAVTKFIPQDWRYVRVWPTRDGDNTVVLRIECLYREEKRGG